MCFSSQLFHGYTVSVSFTFQVQSEGDGEQLSVAEGINAQLLMVSSPDYKT